MGACQAKEPEEEPKEEPKEARRARAVGLALADSMSPTGEELDELARREAMAPMKINCLTEQGEVMPCCACVRLPVFLFCFVVNIFIPPLPPPPQSYPPLPPPP